jgi:hypothetical protein
MYDLDAKIKYMYIFLFVELKNSMSEKEWKILIRKVNISRHLTLDVVSETAYAVMKHLDDDEQICVIRQLSSLAPRDMGQGGKFRLVNTILYELGRIS